MSLTRIVLLVVVLALVVASSVVVIRSVWPRRVDTPRARRLLWLGAGVFLVLVIALEWAARTYAPPGGGALRLPVALARFTVFTSFATMLALAAKELVLAPVYFVLAWRERRAPLEAPAPTAGTATPDRATASADVVAASPSPALSDVALSRRDVLRRGTSIAVVAATSGTMAYGALHAARDLRVRELEVLIPDLPPALEGLTIVQLTDIHVGLFTGERDFRAVIDRSNALRGDLVVLTGDLLDANPHHVPEAMRLFRQIRGRRGTYAILGNHDHFTGADEVLAGLSSVGISTLVNQGVVIPGGARDPGLALLGIDDVWAPRYDPARRPDLGRALRDVPPDAPRILLAHNPVLFRPAAGRVALQLSGHTHGGQINPANIMRYGLRYVAGRYTKDDSTLVISNGLGLTGPPIRLGAPPEILRIGLTGRRRG